MKKTIGRIITVAVIAALYAIFTYVSAAFGLAYGGIQFRISEALMILALFSGEAVWGLALGCVLSNVASTLGAADVLFGTLATLLSALAIRYIASRLKTTVAKCLMTAGFTVFFNAFIIAAEIVLLTDTAIGVFWLTCLQVGIGELAVCLLLCYPLYQIITKNKILKNFFADKRS